MSNPAPPRRPAVRPARADGRRNYDALLLAARRVFEAKGASASLEDIAQGAGVAIGTLYGHFPTREALMEAATRQELAALLAFGEEVAARDEPLAALHDWLLRAVEFCSTYRGMVTMLTRGLHDEASLWRDGCHAMEACGKNLLAAAQDCGGIDPGITTRELFDLVGAAAWLRETSPREDGGSARLVQIFLDGITRG